LDKNTQNRIGQKLELAKTQKSELGKNTQNRIGQKHKTKIRIRQKHKKQNCAKTQKSELGKN
jgi:hypothetical protein